MKKLLFILLLLIISLSSNAQWSCGGLITFDPGDTLNPVAITIDTTHHLHNIWQMGAPHKTELTSAYSLPNAIVTDTLNPYPVNDTSVFILKMPTSLQSVGQTLFDIQFYYQLDIDSGAVAKVEISGDSGIHWINVVDSLSFGFSWDGGPVPNLSSSTTGWTRFYIQGCAYCPGASDTVLFRFTFISDSVPSTKDGWIIDNIGIQYWCESNVAQIQNNTTLTSFPNPATTSLTIQSTNEPIHQITITNLLGQTIYSNDYNSQQVEVDVANLPSGVYFIKINGNEVRKFVKE